MTVIPTTELELAMYPQIKQIRDILRGCAADRAYTGLNESIEFVLEQMTVSGLDFRYVLTLIAKFVSNGLYVEQYLKVHQV